MPTKAIVGLLIIVVILAGCGVFGGNKASQEGITTDKIELSPTQTSQEKAFTGLRLILYAGIALAGIGFGLLFVPILKTWALGCMAAGGLMSFIALTLNQHYILISWIGLGLGLAGIGLLGWLLWKNRKALVQVVWTLESAKGFLDGEQKPAMFGDPAVPNDHGNAGEIQSPATEKLVAKIRGK